MFERTPDPDEIVNDETGNIEERKAQEREPFLRRIRIKLGQTATGYIERHTERSEQKEQRRYDADLDQYVQGRLRSTEKLVTDDTEILGESPSVKTEFHAKAKDATQTLDKTITEARVHSPLRSWRTSRIESSRDHYKRKVDRLQRKIDLHPNSLLNKWRKSELDTFQKRVSWRNKKLAKHAGKVEKIQTKHDNRSKKRNEALKKRVDYYVDKKIEAMRRKEERKLLRKEGITARGPLDKKDRVRFLANLPEDQRKAITRAAILEVRRENIRRGKLDATYEVDESQKTRKINDYERTITD